MLRFLPIIVLLSTCGNDETLTGYGEPDAVYVLQTLDDLTFPGHATLILSAAGEISGSGPCNTYHATQTVPYPWFEVGAIAATRMACPDLDMESAFFSALTEMELAEAQGSVLILSNAAGRQMVFYAE